MSFYFIFTQNIKNMFRCISLNLMLWESLGNIEAGELNLIYLKILNDCYVLLCRKLAVPLGLASEKLLSEWKEKNMQKDTGIKENDHEDRRT